MFENSEQCTTDIIANTLHFKINNEYKLTTVNKHFHQNKLHSPRLFPTLWISNANQLLPPKAQLRPPLLSPSAHSIRKGLIQIAHAPFHKGIQEGATL